MGSSQSWFCIRMSQFEMRWKLSHEVCGRGRRKNLWQKKLELNAFCAPPLLYCLPEVGAGRWKKEKNKTNNSKPHLLLYNRFCYLLLTCCFLYPYLCLFPSDFNITGSTSFVFLLCLFHFPFFAFDPDSPLLSREGLVIVWKLWSLQHTEGMPVSEDHAGNGDVLCFCRGSVWLVEWMLVK